MYTESFGNPRKFARIARRVSRHRPIVAVRTGAAAIGPSGRRAVPAGRADRGADRGGDARHGPGAGHPAGDARARTSPCSPTPAARRRSAGPRCTRPVWWPSTAPFRLDWRSTPDDYGAAVRAALADDDVDAVMVVHAPPLADAVAAPVAAIEAAADGGTKPVVVVLMGGAQRTAAAGSPVPRSPSPSRRPASSAAPTPTAPGSPTRPGRRPPTSPTSTGPRAGDIIAGRARPRRATRLDTAEVVAVLGAYGVAVPETRAGPATEAVAAADAIGYPVAVKAEHRHLGRSVRAGVALDLGDAHDVVDAVRTMQDAIGADADVVVVQAMVAPGLDLRIRSTLDDRLGPLVAIGLGGSTADLVSDEASRLAPLSSAAPTALLAGSRAGPALDQAGLPRRGRRHADAGRPARRRPPRDHAADLNPIIVSRRGRRRPTRRSRSAPPDPPPDRCAD